MAHHDADAAPEPEEWVWDPAYLVCLRELKWVFVVFGLLLAWTIGVSSFLGYGFLGDGFLGNGGAKEAPVEIVLGIPKWFWWGVAAPWAVGAAVSVVFALGYMRDHEPPSEMEEEDAAP